MSKYLCGIDIGGSKLAAGLMSLEGDLLSFVETEDHLGRSESELMDFTANLVHELCLDFSIGVSDLLGVGVGMAGHIHHSSGVVLTTSNLPGFKHYPLVKELGGRLCTRVNLENDANCQAWAEYKYGAGVNYDTFVFITVSTGIGAGLVLNGKLYRGSTGTAGEFGHSIIEPSSDIKCSCGNYGCFMSHASTLSLDQLVSKKSSRGLPTNLPISSTSLNRITGKHISHHAKLGDVLSREIISEYANYLGILSYNIFQIFNPQLIIIGGGLVNLKDNFIQDIESKFLSLASNMLYEPLPIVSSITGSSSGVLGAGSLLLE